MLCSRCGKNEASLLLKQIVNNQVTELRLCDSCSQKMQVPGLSLSPPTISPFPQSAEKRYQKLRCPACGMRYAEFRETGLLGCPHCYESFAEPLRGLLKHIHGSMRHEGKSPQARAAPGQETERLRRELHAAVKAEKFEEAARLRDRLRHLEK